MINHGKRTNAAPIKSEMPLFIFRCLTPNASNGSSPVLRFHKDRARNSPELRVTMTNTETTAAIG